MTDTIQFYQFCKMKFLMFLNLKFHKFSQCFSASFFCKHIFVFLSHFSAILLYAHPDGDVRVGIVILLLLLSLFALEYLIKIVYFLAK